MLCQVCGKNDANVEFTEIINDEVKQLQLCDGCAKKKGIEMEQHFSIADFLASMSDMGSADPNAAADSGASLKCEKCGMTFGDFQKIGRFGCGNCYLAFRKNLLPLLKRIHGSTRHMGKAVKDASGLRHTLRRNLQYKLQSAIGKEEFEEAAKLRDMIRELEKKPGDEG
jgi:protein arginine kinase activator